MDYEDEVEEIMQDIDILNRFYNKGYITLREFVGINNAMTLKLSELYMKHISDINKL